MFHSIVVIRSSYSRPKLYHCYRGSYHSSPYVEAFNCNSLTAGRIIYTLAESERYLAYNYCVTFDLGLPFEWLRVLFYRNLFSYFILSLCISDLLSTLVSPLCWYRRTLGFDEWRVPDILCKVSDREVMFCASKQAFTWRECFINRL